MQNIFIDILPPWVETGLQPAFYDLESGTVLQQTARMYAKVRELTEAFNTFTENIINEVTTFEQNTNDEIERFENATNEEIERFEGVINDTVDEYIGKFNDLHDYVEDYFENLDVQKEIDHKLDEMVDDGVLQEIITTYIQSNVSWTFDSVAEMQSATNLTADSYAQTYGFYSVNDGGASKYKIRNKEVSETADNIFTFAIGDNLIAEYVYEGVYRTKQLGVKADGSEDVSAKLQAIINKIDTDNLANTSSYTPLTFDSGIYKVDNQIELSVNVPLKANGLVTIKSYVDNASCLWIKPKASDPDTWFTRTEKFISGDGFIIEYAGENSGYGLEIGSTTDLGSYKGFMHSKLEDITFKFFDIAIKFNPIHIFCDTFTRIQFEQCDIQVQWGSNGFTLVDSGERITFTECQFGGNHARVFELYNAVSSLFVNDSSMDYCDCVFNDAGNVGYSNVYINNCHIEGVTYGMTPEDKAAKPYGIIYGNFMYSQFVFSNGQIGVRPRGVLFTYLSDATPTSSKYRAVIDNMMIGTPDNTNTPSELYFVADGVNVIEKGITGNPLNRSLGVSKFDNVIPYALFEGATVGSTSVAVDSVISGSTVTYIRSVSSTGEVYSNATTGGKGIKFTVTSTTQTPSVQIRSPKFDVRSGDKLYVCGATTNFNNAQINVEYYDITDTIISTDTRTPTSSTTPSSSTTYIPENMMASIVPQNAVKATVRLVCATTGRTLNVDDTLSIDGFYCFKG